MRHLTGLISGLAFVILLSFLLTPFLSEIYSDFKGLSPGPDGEAELADFLIFIQWPVYFVMGFLVGFIGHKKILTRRSSGRS